MCPLPRLLVRPVTPRATRDVTSHTTLKSRTIWHLSVSTIVFAPLCRPLPKKDPKFKLKPVLRVQMFLSLQDPDPVIRGNDPDPSITKPKQ